jgi:hypothetical protein
MPAMGVDDAVLGNLPQPEPECHRRILKVILQPPIGFDQHVLNDIADIDTALDFLVQPHPDDLAQRLTVPFHQLVHGSFISLLDLQEQFFGLVLFRPHLLPLWWPAKVLAIVQRVVSQDIFPDDFFDPTQCQGNQRG